MIDAMKQALDTLDRLWDIGIDAEFDIPLLPSMNALRQAIKEAEKHDEPVAWISDSQTKGNGKQLHFTKAEAWHWSSNITPLYAAPPRKEWVSLTDDEMFNAIQSIDNTTVRLPPGFKLFACAIEAKLREKNQ